MGMQMLRLRQYFIVLLMLLAGATLSQQLQAQCNLSFSGTVFDQDSKEALKEATIFIKELNKTVVSDSKGEFIFRGLCPGSYTIIVSHVNCTPQPAHIHLREDLHKDIEIPHNFSQLGEVVVRGTASASQTTPMAELKGKQLEATRGLTLGESLQRVNGVTVLQTGNNIYKPVINGLHSNRILILNNGIRQEGQQWGSEHAPEVDPYLANRLTVIKGSSSIRYGGDAIGGVVLVEPKLLPYRQSGLTGELNTALFSNNRMGVISAMVESSLKNKPQFAWRLQGTAKRGGDARTPDYWLQNSGVQELNFSATGGWQQPTKGVELFYSYFSTKLGIFSGSHIGNVTDLMNAIESGDPPDYIKDASFSYAINRPYQSVQHHLFKAKGYVQTGEFSRLNIIGSFQNNHRREYDIVRSPRSNPQLELSLYTTALDLAWDHYKGKYWKGTVGMSGSFQLNDINYRYFIPNYIGINTGAFITEKYTRGNWIAEAGLRYDLRWLNNITDNDASPNDVLTGDANNPGDPYGTRSFNGFSGNAGVTYKLKRWRFNVSGGSAWRAPQVNELFADGLHHGAARIEKGKTDLVPERSLGLQAEVEYANEKFTLTVNGYYKRINDFIYLKPTYPPQLTIRGAFPTFEYDQTDARMTGLDMQASYIFFSHLKIAGKASVLRAFDLLTDDWLIQMPADRYEASAEYMFDEGNKFKGTYLRITGSHVNEQTRVPATGNIEIKHPDGTVTMESDYAPPPPGYTLLGLEAGTDIHINHRSLGVIFGVTNLLNVRYRDYLNAFRYFCDDMGRNISLRVKVPLNF